MPARPPAPPLLPCLNPPHPRLPSTHLQLARLRRHQVHVAPAAGAGDHQAVRHACLPQLAPHRRQHRLQHVHPHAARHLVLAHLAGRSAVRGRRVEDARGSRCGCQGRGWLGGRAAGHGGAAACGRKRARAAAAATTQRPRLLRMHASNFGSQLLTGSAWHPCPPPPGRGSRPHARPAAVGAQAAKAAGQAAPGQEGVTGTGDAGRAAAAVVVVPLARPGPAAQRSAPPGSSPCPAPPCTPRPPPTARRACGARQADASKLRAAPARPLPPLQAAPQAPGSLPRQPKRGWPAPVPPPGPPSLVVHARADGGDEQVGLRHHPALLRQQPLKQVQRPPRVVHLAAR